MCVCVCVYDVCICIGYDIVWALARLFQRLVVMLMMHDEVMFTSKARSHGAGARTAGLH